MAAVHRLTPLCQESRRHLAAAKVSIIFNRQPLQSLFLALAGSLAFIFCLGGVERIVYAYAYALRVRPCTSVVVCTVTINCETATPRIEYVVGRKGHAQRFVLEECLYHTQLHRSILLFYSVALFAPQTQACFQVQKLAVAEGQTVVENEVKAWTVPQVRYANRARV